jgi:hypothetical protein
MDRYFVPKNKLHRKKAAHIWTGRDTLCRMASTGGLNRKRYEVSDDPGERFICQICSGLDARMPNRKRPAPRQVGVVWEDSWESVEAKAPPSLEEIMAAQTPAGGWTKETLKSWGVSWPPPKGWKSRLIRDHQTLSEAKIKL